MVIDGRFLKFFLLALVLVPAALTQPAHLVVDVGTSVSSSGSSPSNFVGFQGETYFFATNEFVRGLWETDGTQQGTRLVRGGVTGSRPLVVNGTLYFFGRETATGTELWRSDGTTQGTRLVKETRPGPADGIEVVSSLVELSGILYFQASDDVNGEALWRSDGTPAGTTLIKDIDAADGNTFSIGLICLQDFLYFAANDGVNGMELWRSDGTPGGTSMVLDINPGPAGSGLSNLRASDDLLFFWAQTESSGRELWRSDGTAVGTTMVADLRPGPESSAVGTLDVFQGRAYFGADSGDETDGGLWVSDGTLAGTERLAEDIDPWIFQSAGDVLYFLEGIPVFSSFSRPYLWKTDGTREGTGIIADFFGGSISTRLIDLNGSLYFTAHDGASADAFFRTDGTEEGTVFVHEAHPTTGGYSYSYGVVGDTLYFAEYAPDSGLEPWKTDGTPGGASMIKDIGTSAYSSDPRDLTSIGAAAFYTAGTGGPDRHLWVTDGTPGNAEALNTVGQMPNYNDAHDLTSAGGRLYFSATDEESGYEVWTSDGTNEGTAMVADVNPQAGSNPAFLTDVRGTLFSRLMTASPDGSFGGSTTRAQL